MSDLPDAALLADLDTILRAVCNYLGISTGGVPIDPLRSWTEIFRRLDVVEADGQQDSAELQDLRQRTEDQSRLIQSLQTKVAQLELASTPATVHALQDDLDALRRDLDRLQSSWHVAPKQESTPPVQDATDPAINVLDSRASSSFKPSFKEKYTPNEGSINSFLYVYESAMEDATDRQKVKHLPSCLSRLAQEIMVPHLMTCQTWVAVKEALILEFGSSQALSSQKQAFMAIQLKQGEAASSFAERFYREAQVLVTCGKLTMDDAITAAVSSVSAHPHLQLYLKGIKRSFTSIREIKEALLDIPPNLLSSSPAHPKPASASRPRVATVSSTTNTSGNTAASSDTSGDKSTQYPCDYCGGQRHNSKKCFKRRAEAAEKALSA